MIVVWSASAENDRNHIINFIAENNLDAALEMDNLLTECGHKLSEFPYLGHVGRIENTHEITIHPHYILVYQVISSRIEILAIVHTARQWPPIS